MPRKHLVLVPGFVGFDALGQIAYYAGITGLFRQWQRRHSEHTEEHAAVHAAGHAEAALHYFDSFPTASVSMRAERLRSFLGKRIARGEIAAGDEVTLLGHSTGGLDIRKLLIDLLQAHKVTTLDDGLQLTHDELLAPIRRVVFMSVPHYGSNLADFFYDYRTTVQALVHDVAVGLSYNHGFVSDARQWLTSKWPHTRSDLLLAVHDSLNESDVHTNSDPMKRATEREAYAQLSLWLEHMHTDFGAIEDLTSLARSASSESPAHASEAARRDELQAWRAHGAGIRTQTYATRLPSKDVQLPWAVSTGLRVAHTMRGPLGVLQGAVRLIDASPYAPDKLRAFAERSRLGLDGLALPSTLLALHTRPALPFEFAYGACAEGPFEDKRTRDASAVPELLGTELLGTDHAPRMDPHTLSAADSDGVVNTLSMLWPHDAAPDQHEAFFVRADHADIIGHYRLRPERPERPEPDKQASRDRLYDAYDIFESGSGFDDARFERVWQSIFTFAFSA